MIHDNNKTPIPITMRMALMSSDLEEWFAVPGDSFEDQRIADALVAMGYMLSRVKPDTGKRELKPNREKANADAVAAGYADHVADFVIACVEEYLDQQEEGEA